MSSFSSPSRRKFLRNAAIASAATTIYPALGAARESSPETKSAPQDVKAFELDEITIAELQDGMNSGRFSARSLVEKYSARIDEVDKHGPAVNAVIEMNPDAMSI